MCKVLYIAPIKRFFLDHFVQASQFQRSASMTRRIPMYYLFPCFSRSSTFASNAFMRLLLHIYIYLLCWYMINTERVISGASMSKGSGSRLPCRGRLAVAVVAVWHSCWLSVRSARRRLHLSRRQTWPALCRAAWLWSPGRAPCRVPQQRPLPRLLRLAGPACQSYCQQERAQCQAQRRSRAR